MRLNQVRASVLVASALVLAASPVSAQQTPPATEFGIKGGVNIGTLTEFADAVGDAGLETGRRTGLLVGGYVSRRLTDGLFFQPEVLFVQKGITISGGVLGISMDAAVKLSYVEIPVLFQYRFGSGSAVPYVFGGPAIGFNTSARVNASVFGMGGDEDEDVGDEVRDVETSIVLGGGVMMRRWLAEVRFARGLSALNEEGAVDLNKDIKTSSIAAAFGVRF